MSTLNQKSLTELLLPEGKRTQFYWDTALHGFGLLLRLDARDVLRKTWIVQYRTSEGQRRRKLGDAAKLNADAARKKALAMLGKVAEGIDPAGDREERKPTLTFATRVSQYLEMAALEVRAQTQKLNKLYLTRPQYFGDLHRLPLDKINRSRVSECLDAINVNSGRASARRCCP